MKKQIIISMLIILLVGTLIAQIVLTRNIDITLDKNTKDKLAEYNITNPQTSELICDSITCKFELYDTYQVTQIVLDEEGNISETYIIDERYELGTHTFQRGDMTTQQILNKQDEIIETFLKEYVLTLIERENKEVKTKVGDEGRIILI